MRTRPDKARAHLNTRLEPTLVYAPPNGGFLRWDLNSRSFGAEPSLAPPRSHSQNPCCPHHMSLLLRQKLALSASSALVRLRPPPPPPSSDGAGQTFRSTLCY